MDNGNHKSNRHRQSRYFIRRWLISPLWIAIFLEGFVIAALAVWSVLLQQEVKVGDTKEQALNQTISDGKAELEGLRWEFNEYKNQQEQGCMPNLIPIKFDSVMSINKDYIKSAMFMLSGRDQQKVLDYKIVLKNVNPTYVSPQFEIVFFTAMGNQMGTVQIGYDKQGAPSKQILEKGEVRSINGTFELTDGIQPQFIMIQFNKSADTNHNNE